MINRRQGALVALAFALFSCTWTAFAAPVTSLNFSDLLHSFSQPPVNVRDLPLQDAIKTIQGNGKRTVYVVTDPDCRYCRQLDSELTQIKNVTIYRFEDPLTELHPNAANIAKQIWCAPDRSG
jgi:thioredoxin-related protein